MLHALRKPVYLASNAEFIEGRVIDESAPCFNALNKTYDSERFVVAKSNGAEVLAESQLSECLLKGAENGVLLGKMVMEMLSRAKSNVLSVNASFPCTDCLRDVFSALNIVSCHLNKDSKSTFSSIDENMLSSTAGQSVAHKGMRIQKTFFEGIVANEPVQVWVLSLWDYTKNVAPLEIAPDEKYFKIGSLQLERQSFVAFVELCTEFCREYFKAVGIEV